MTNKTSQIPLDLEHEPSFAFEDFIVSSSNEAANDLICNWPAWPQHAVAIVGPAASGKTHLARAWAAYSGATLYSGLESIKALDEGSAVLIEDIDRLEYPEKDVFHLFNWVKEISGSLLMTSRLHPTRLKITLPDLRSRLATVFVGELQEPDDQLLTAVLVKLFSDRQLQVDMLVVEYLLPRIERSFSAIVSLVDLMDRTALAGKRKITRDLAKTCLNQ